MDVNKIMSEISDEKIFSRQELCNTVKLLCPDFKDTLLRNLLQNLLQKEFIIRVGRNQYRKTALSVKRADYQNNYSKRAKELAAKMEENFPLLDYRIWELCWLNEFWNHQIGQNKIFLEVEEAGCDFVYTKLNEENHWKMLLKPDIEEIYRYAINDTVIISRLITESPKGNPEKYNTPLEKIIVDLFANKLLKSMLSMGEYPMAISEMFDKYKIDQTKLFRYARRRNKQEQIYQFLEQETEIQILSKRN